MAIPDLGVQRNQAIRIDLQGTADEGVCRLLRELVPPFRDLCRMDLELLAQFGHRLDVAQDGQCGTCLERPGVRAPGALCECHRHEELLLVRPFSDRHQPEVSNHRADQTCGATSHTYTFILGLK